MLTAFADEDYQEQARRIGASGYIVKPIDKDTLFPQLEVALKAYYPQ
jgi:AmiR/NasT family two-component response regulator